MSRGRPAALKRDDALKILTDLLWREGVDHVSLDHMASTLGVTKPTLCRTFGAREEIVAQALDAYYGHWGVEIENRVREALTFADTVRAMLSVVIDRANDPKNPRGCLITETAAVAPAPGPIYDMLTKQRETLVPLLEWKATTAQAKREINPAHHPQEPVRWLISQQVALVALTRRAKRQGELDRAVDAAVYGVKAFA